MGILYTIGLFAYQLIVVIVSLFNNKAKQFTNGRKNWKQHLPKINKNEEWIWFQASSQGEFEDGVMVIKRIRKEYPHLKILLTFFSPSGYENKRNHEVADHTMYLPMDYTSNAAFFFDHFHFKAIFFLRHDIWRNYLREAKKRQIPSFLIFCTLTPSSSTLRFPARTFFKNGFRNFTHIFCHDEHSMTLLKHTFNCTNTSVAGSTRVENIAQKEIKDTSRVDEFIGDAKSVIMGSSAMIDEKMLSGIVAHFNSENIKWIIVPHEIDRDFSHIPDHVLYTDASLDHTKNILVVNAIGLLFSLYNNKDIAIIGGGFSKTGIHNTIEAAIFGVPVLFGPNHRDYPEALALLNEKQAFIYRNEKELMTHIRNLLDQKREHTESHYIKDNQHTSEKIVQTLREGFKF